jgi:hypothetical protein
MVVKKETLTMNNNNNNPKTKIFSQYISESKEFLFEKAYSFDIQPSTASTAKILDRIRDFSKTKFLGSGVEAVAYFNESTQMIVKIIKFKNHMTKEDVKKESTYKYLKEITKEFNSGNPHFPKIYSVKFFESPDNYPFNYDKPIYGVIKMERLHSIKDSDEYTIEAAIRNTGIKFATESKYSEYMPFLIKISDYVEGYMDSSFIKEINDSNPKFAKALIIIRKLIKKYRFKTDLHQGNIMIRLTSVGPQLVISDPLLPKWFDTEGKSL